MSVEVSELVWRAPFDTPTKKLTMLHFADRAHDGGGGIFCSMADVAARVGLSRSQAQRSVRALIGDGLLHVTANAHGGAPGDVPHYRVDVERLWSLIPADMADKLRARRTSATGSVDATGSSGAVEGSRGCTGGAAPMRQTHSTGATQTVLNRPLTVHNPKTPAKRESAPAGFEPPTWIDPRLWAAYLDVRRVKRSGNGAHALGLIVRSLEQFKAAGHDPIAILEHSVSCGYVGVFEPRSASATERTSRHSGFQQKNYREGVSKDGSLV